jgi:hypothetical protein
MPVDCCSVNWTTATVSPTKTCGFSDWLLDLYLKTHPGPRKVIVLEMNATVDPTHGPQRLRFFYDYYEEHMYHPLLVAVKKLLMIMSF